MDSPDGCDEIGGPGGSKSVVMDHNGSLGLCPT